MRHFFICPSGFYGFKKCLPKEYFFITWFRAVLKIIFLLKLAASFPAIVRLHRKPCRLPASTSLAGKLSLTLKKKIL